VAGFSSRRQRSSRTTRRWRIADIPVGRKHSGCRPEDRPLAPASPTAKESARLLSGGPENQPQTPEVGRSLAAGLRDTRADVAPPAVTALCPAGIPALNNTSAVSIQSVHHRLMTFVSCSWSTLVEQVSSLDLLAGLSGRLPGCYSPVRFRTESEIMDISATTPPRLKDSAAQPLEVVEWLRALHAVPVAAVALPPDPSLA